MSANLFTLKILHLSWLLPDEDNDLCAHARFFVKIGNEVLCDISDAGYTASAAAIHLMRTLDSDYTYNDFAGQLLPCCGHFMLDGGNMEYVIMMGCANGIDWEVQHQPDKMVKLTTPTGHEALISFDSYKDQILALADAVEAFYDFSKPIILPEDEDDRNGYLTMWNEWRLLRSKW